MGEAHTLAVDKRGVERLFITDGQGRKLTEGTFNPDLLRYRSSLYGTNLNNISGLNAEENEKVASLLNDLKSA